MHVGTCIVAVGFATSLATPSLPGGPAPRPQNSNRMRVVVGDGGPSPFMIDIIQIPPLSTVGLLVTDARWPSSRPSHHSWWRRLLYGLPARRCRLGVRRRRQGHVVRQLRLCPSRWRRRRPIRDLAERLRRRDRRRWRRQRRRDNEHRSPWRWRRRVHRDGRFRCWKRRRIWSIAARQGRGRPGRRAQPARQDLGDPVHWSRRWRVS